MLIPRDQIEFDFKAARFNLEDSRDREFLGWVFNQFLYGEVTGIQCGHWLYRAPTLNAALFLAKQAGEELSHVKRMLRILSLLRCPPGRAHFATRFLSTGMMGRSWGEHVTLEMALGEGLVLSVFYALSETIDVPEIKKLLESAALDEERHVEFGERESREWIARYPNERANLLAQALVQWLALRALKRFVKGQLTRWGGNHPVLSQFPEFYDHVVRGFDLRIQRLGLSSRSLSEFSLFQRWFLVIGIPVWKLRSRFRFLGGIPRAQLLTETYLEDPVVRGTSDSFKE